MPSRRMQQKIKRSRFPSTNRMLRPYMFRYTQKTALVIPTDRALGSLKQARKIQSMTTITGLIILEIESGAQRDLDYPCPIHSVPVTSAAGIEAGFAGEEVAVRTPCIPDVVCDCLIG